MKVADFGLAKSLRIPKGESRLIAGTSEYVSPEQGLGNAVDIRSDIYSLGIVLYELLAGRPPFRSTGSFTRVIHQHVHVKLPPLERVAGPLPGPVLDLVRRCLAKRPQDRYQTPEELLADLSRVRSGLESSTSAPASEPEGTFRLAFRSTWRRVRRAVGKFSGRVRRNG